MHVVLYDCLVLSLYRYYPNITIIVYKYYVLFAFKNLICTRHNILISILIFMCQLPRYSTNQHTTKVGVREGSLSSHPLFYVADGVAMVTRQIHPQGGTYQTCSFYNGNPEIQATQRRISKIMCYNKTEKCKMKNSSC